MCTGLTKHRGPRRGDPHRKAPQIGITRIERIRVPRLQEKYLVELQDIAGLTEQKTTALTSVAAPRVQSVDGLDLNEYLMYHGAPADLVDRLEKQGLDPRYAGEHFGKLFGCGIYLATNAISTLMKSRSRVALKISRTKSRKRRAFIPTSSA